MTQKRFLRFASVLWFCAIATVACNKEYFELSKITSDSITPTIAVPIADMDITIEELVLRYGSLASKVYDPKYSTPSDSVFFLQVEYSDTLAEFPGPPQAIPQGAPSDTFRFDLDSIELNLFGQLGGENALFRLVNPTVKFSFINSIDKGFSLDFDTLYTRNIESNAIFPFRVKSEFIPFTIDRAETPGVGLLSQIELNNNNIESFDGSPNPMTRVIEPTPKFVYHKSTLTPIGTDAVAAGGSIKTVATVLLPLEGYGKFNYRDTLPFKAVDTNFSNVVKEVVLRMLFTNSIPLDAEITASIYDTLTWTKIYEIPIYDENGDVKPNGAFIESAVLQGADQDYRPAQAKGFYSDVKMSAQEFKKIMTGNAIVVNAALFSAGFDRDNPDYLNSSTVKIYTDFGIRVQMGLKTTLNGNPSDIVNGIGGSFPAKN